MFKKLVLSVLSVVILFQATASSALAAAPPATWYNQGIQEWYRKVYDTDVSPAEEIFGERYTAAQVDWIIWSILTWVPTKILNPDGTACLIGLFMQLFSGGGFDIINCKDKILGAAPSQEYFAVNPIKNDETLFHAVFLRDRDLSGIKYVKDLVGKVTSVPTANAQGFGYTQALTPFRLMWTASRDIAYSFFVFAAIILAFMIMFRVKLSPQTAVTVQSAIPKLIFGLILVTFSYAIAGFLIDLMYVVIGILSIAGARFISPDINPVLVYNFMTVGPYITLPFEIFGNSVIGLGILGLFLFYLVAFFLTFVIVGLTYFGIAGVVATAALTAIGIAAVILSGGTLGLIALLIFLIILVIVAIAVFIMILKTVWAIIQAFANIILLTVFAPFQLLLGTFVPSMGFGTWVKSYISNLGVFVGVGFLFLLATVFLVQAVANAFSLFGAGVGQGIFQDALNLLFGSSAGAVIAGQATPGWPPLLNYGLLVNSQATVSLFYLTFSFVIFFQIPKVADMIKSFISGRPWAYGTAIGEGMGLFGAAYGSGISQSFRKEMSEQGAATGSAAMSKLFAEQSARSGSQMANSFATFFRKMSERVRRE